MKAKSNTYSGHPCAYDQGPRKSFKESTKLYDPLTSPPKPDTSFYRAAQISSEARNMRRFREEQALRLNFD